MAKIPPLRESMGISPDVWLICPTCGQILTTTEKDTDTLKLIVDKDRPYNSGWDVICPNSGCLTTIRFPFWLNYPGPGNLIDFIGYLYYRTTLYFPPKP
jgi:hypothetical protein